MEQARNRLPIEARAKCNGTRSGVSIMRMSSVVSVADIELQENGILFDQVFEIRPTSQLRKKQSMSLK
jgi:hypothetical protein